MMVMSEFIMYQLIVMMVYIIFYITKNCDVAETSSTEKNLEHNNIMNFDERTRNYNPNIVNWK